MNPLRLTAVLCLLAGGGAWGAGYSQPPAQGQQPHIPSQSPQQPQMINLSVVDALVAIHEEGLAGLFGYIAEPNAGPAFAEYLFRTPKALKLFLQKGEDDLKAAGGINQWDKEVFLYLIGLNSNASLVGGQALPDKVMRRVSTLSLAPGLSLSEITMHRKR